MSNPSRIITLIQQDLQHHHLLANFAHRAEIEQEHHFELLGVVHELMNVPDSAELDFGKTYYNYMGLAALFPLDASPENIRGQAELCYEHLLAIVEVEREWLGRS